MVSVLGTVNFCGDSVLGVNRDDISKIEVGRPGYNETYEPTFTFTKAKP